MRIPPYIRRTYQQLGNRRLACQRKIARARRRMKYTQAGAADRIMEDVQSLLDEIGHLTLAMDHLAMLYPQVRDADESTH